VLWGLAYIYQTSFIAMDGHRYFALFDDAMISMRYAWNFSHGLGLVWNPGERVEGYTNPLMVLLMSAATLLPDKSLAVLVIQLLAVPTLLGTAWGSIRLLRACRSAPLRVHPAFAETAVFVSVLLYYPLGFWTLTGMETGLVALLLVFAVTSSINLLGTGKPTSAIWMSCTLGLAFLTRNDSMLYALVVFAYLGLQLRSSRHSLKGWLLGLGIYSLFVIAQQSFRYSYYHAWVPNTYILKLTGMLLQDRLRNGILFVQPFLLETAVLLVLGIVGALVWGSRTDKYLVALFVVSVFYQVYVGGEPWDRWRMMSAVMPLLLPVVVIQSTRFGRTLTRGYPSRSLVAGILVAGGLLLADARFWPEILLQDRPNPGNPARMDMALAVNALTDETATVGVFHAGLLPYYTGRRAVDFLGKADPYIARLPPHFLLPNEVGLRGVNSPPGHNKYDLNYSIKGLRPTYVQGFQWYGDSVENWAQRHYVEATYGPLDLYLLADSPSVRWNLLPDLIPR
jgi:hypothetical protein